MRSFVTYVCEICGRTSQDVNYIRECEARGRRDEKAIKVGCLGGDHRLESFYKDCIFAAASVRIDTQLLMGHGIIVGSWACRDHSAGDSLGDDGYCNPEHMFMMGRPAHIDWEKPATKRMIAALREKGIEPTVWDGKGSAPIPEGL